MSPLLLLAFVATYFALLLGVAWRTSRNVSEAGFYTGARSSHWACRPGQRWPGWTRPA